MSRSSHLRYPHRWHRWIPDNGDPIHNCQIMIRQITIRQKQLMNSLASCSEPLADFLDPIPIAGIGGKQFAHRTALQSLYCKQGWNPLYYNRYRPDIQSAAIQKAGLESTRKSKKGMCQIASTFLFAFQKCDRTLVRFTVTFLWAARLPVLWLPASIIHLGHKALNMCRFHIFDVQDWKLTGEVVFKIPQLFGIVAKCFGWQVPYLTVKFKFFGSIAKCHECRLRIW